MTRLTLLEAVIRLRRWWGLPLLGILLGLAASVVAYRCLPREYEAHTTIMVAPPQIPQSYVRSTISEDMAIRLHSLQEAVLSRPYMRRIAEEIYGIAPGSEEFESWLRDVRNRIVIELSEYDPRRGTGIFQIRFRDGDPGRVAHLVNRLAELYIAENVRLRTAQAKSTAETLRHLAEEVRAELEAKEKVIADFRSRHLYELEDYLQSNLNLLETRRSELEATEQALARSRDHLRILEMQAEAGAAVVNAPADPLLRRKQELESELDELRGRYTDANPIVRRRKAELDEVERQLAARRKRTGENAGLDPLALEIERARKEIERLEKERDRLREEIQVYQRRIEATPRVAQQLEELTKGYEALQERYRKYRQDYEEARGAVRIEEERRGSQFEIVERAVPASRPVRPRAWLVFSGVTGMVVLLVVGPFLGWHLLRPVILSRRVLEELVAVDVIAVIPELPRPPLRRVRALRLAVNVLLVLAGVALLVVSMTPAWGTVCP